MNILDGNVTSGDFLDYLKGLVEFGVMISSAAGEEVVLNTHIQQTVTAKKSRREAIRNEALGITPAVKAIKNVLAVKKKQGNAWFVFDATGKKRLGGPFSSEVTANRCLVSIVDPKKPVTASKKPVEDVPSQLEPSQVYALSRKANAFVSWASVKGDSKLKSYASSINTGITALSRKVGSSLYASKNVSEISFTANFGLRAIEELYNALGSVQASKLGTEEKKHVAGLWNDVVLAKKILTIRLRGE